MNKIYLVDGKPYEVAPHREEEFLSTMKSQGKTPVLQEQGNQQSSAEDATVEQTTTASTPEVDQPQQNQGTELTSENTSSESPSFDWLNYQQSDGSVSTKPFFNQSEEQAVAQLRAKYPGFKTVDMKQLTMI
jgi:hypothetical protein